MYEAEIKSSLTLFFLPSSLSSHSAGSFSFFSSFFSSSFFAARRLTSSRRTRRGAGVSFSLVTLGASSLVLGFVEMSFSRTLPFRLFKLSVSLSGSSRGFLSASAVRDRVDFGSVLVTEATLSVSDGSPLYFSCGLSRT